MSRTSTRSTSSSFGCSWSRDGRPMRSRPPSGCGREAFQSRLGGRSSIAALRRPTDVPKRSCASASGSCSAPSPTRRTQGRPANRQQSSRPVLAGTARRRAGVPGVSRRSRGRVARGGNARGADPERLERSRPGSRRTRPCWSTWSARDSLMVFVVTAARRIGEDDSAAASRPERADRAASGPDPPPRRRSLDQAGGEPVGGAARADRGRWVAAWDTSLCTSCRTAH